MSRQFVDRLARTLSDSGQSDSRGRTSLQLNLHHYQDQTRRPLVSLVFVLPILATYEFGVLFLGQHMTRNGAEHWMREVLYWVGLGQYLVLPLLTALVLLSWHHWRRDSWRFSPVILGGMLMESVCLAMILFCAAKANQLLFADVPAALPVASIAGGEGSSLYWWDSTFKYLGAGIYEELLFRLLMLPTVIAISLTVFRSRRASWITGVLLTSVVFALVHYQLLNPAGAEFEISTFFVRFFASILLCVVFLYRGFGIAVGTHASYDILTQI